MKSGKPYLITIALSFSFLITGCATRDVKSNIALDNIKNIQLLPTGSFEIKGYTSTIGVLFGSVGVITENSLSQKSNKIIGEKTTEANPSDFVFEKIIDEFDTYLKNKKNDINITISRHSLTNERISAIYKTNNRALTSELTSEKIDLVAEFGISNLTIKKSLIGSFVEGHVFIRLIDPRSGNILARSHTYGFGAAAGGEKINPSNENLNEEEYARAVSDAITRFVKKTSRRAIENCF